MTPFAAPPFIVAASPFVDDGSARRLSRLVATGELVRVRRGLYLQREVWAALRSWEQYHVTIAAVQRLARTAPVFARESAAQILGLPLIGVPREVHTVIASARSGGQSSAGIHRTRALLGDPRPWIVDGFRVTPPPQTARDLALRLPLTHSLPAMDRLLEARPLPGAGQNVAGLFTADHVLAAAGVLPFASQRRRVERVLSVAVSVRQSAGESFSRALMIQHQLPLPSLQTAFGDGRGLIGYVDFCWEAYKLIGEFDGHEKYGQQRYLRGHTPSEVVVQEKNRENRLRQLGYSVVRWEWRDLLEPTRLLTLLHDAGLPTR